jgi:hypothetical protein
MALQDAFYRYANPSQISAEAPTEWHNIVMGAALTATDPQSGSTIHPDCRCINVYLPAGVQSDNGIVYIAVTGQSCTYYPAYSGVHVLRARSFVSAGSDIDSTRLQWGT